MKCSVFQGVSTALVTPFLGREINYPMLERLLGRQMESGIRSVVLCGTTGEAATLSDGEKLEIIRRGKAFAGDKCQIIAGTGSNNTVHAVELSVAAQRMGADALLVVSPYYNKATPEGLYQHFAAIAHAVHIPVILYNVPSRTGLDMPVGVYRRLSRINNIVGVKEATGDITKISEILQACGPDFCVWSGNDNQAVAAIALGAQGVISVLSNVAPVETQAMAQAALDGDFDTASALNLRLGPWMKALFQEVNPVPVKAAMKILGYDCGDCRLPLSPAIPETVEGLQQCLLPITGQRTGS